MEDSLKEYLEESEETTGEIPEVTSTRIPGETSRSISDATPKLIIVETSGAITVVDGSLKKVLE